MASHKITFIIFVPLPNKYWLSVQSVKFLQVLVLSLTKDMTQKQHTYQIFCQMYCGLPYTFYFAKNDGVVLSCFASQCHKSTQIRNMFNGIVLWPSKHFNSYFVSQKCNLSRGSFADCTSAVISFRELSKQMKDIQKHLCLYLLWVWHLAWWTHNSFDEIELYTFWALLSNCYGSHADTPDTHVSIPRLATVETSLFNYCQCWRAATILWQV